MGATVLLLSLFIFSVVKLRDGYILRTKFAYSGVNIRLTDRHMGGIAAQANDVGTPDAIDGLLHEFDRQLSNEDFDAQAISRLHMDVILTLVKSDVQDRDDDDGSESHLFPQSYLTALIYMVDLTNSLRERKSPLFTSANMISKKEGIAQVLKSVKSMKDQLMSSREIVEVKRKTERVLSQLLTLSIAYNSCFMIGTETDFMFFAKALLEKTPIHDKHFALLLFSRGIMTPPHRSGTSAKITWPGRGESFNDLAAVARLSSISLSRSFKMNMADLGISQPSLSARMLYPFASVAMRAFVASSTKTITPKRKSDDWFSYDSSRSDDSEELTSEKLFDDADKKLCLLLQACIIEDTHAEKLREMTGSGDEVLSTLRRWICDLAATHFMNDEDGLFSTRDGLPEEIKKNTVAMELLCTERAFCEGKKRDRTRFLSLFEEIGNYLEVLSSLRESRNQIDMEPSALPLAPNSKFTFRVKKTVAAISATKFLPRTHKLRVGMENGGVNSFMGAYNAHKKEAALSALREKRPSSLADQGAVLAVDDDMWATATPSTRTGSSRSSVSSQTQTQAVSKMSSQAQVSDDDDDMWASASPKELGKQKRAKKALESAPVPVDFDLIPQVDQYLLQIIADVLKVDEAVVMQPHVRDEVDYVFSTWRRPHLLLDYHRMHSSTPDIQNNFRRFLSALFGVSGETVEDIRYTDPGNRRHFDLLPPELAARWIEGVARNGEILPGYCDPQTLFMIGEDSNTCMGIRARQKGSNRGLLSMLLHGNCRIIGSKDSHGRLTARAVSRLLVDDITGLPVLYVESPYGSIDEDSYVEVYDQAALLGDLLQVPVIYASPPSPTLYVMGDREISAVHSNTNRQISNYEIADWMVEEDEEEEEEGMDSISSSLPQVQIQVEKTLFGNLSDYTVMASHVWIDGIRDPSSGRYLPGHTPFLYIIKKPPLGAGIKEKEEGALTMGGRPLGSLESMVAKGLTKLQPAATKPSEEKEKEKKSKDSVETILTAQFEQTAGAGIARTAAAAAAAAASMSMTAPAISDDSDEAEDEDDFFGVASTMTAYKRRPVQKFSTAAAVSATDSSSSSVPLPSPKASQNAIKGEEAVEVAVAVEPPTAEEIEDKRKSKKQRVVSVQARLAERQRFLSEAQQRRQTATSEINKEKEQQVMEYQLRKGYQLSRTPSTQEASPARDRDMERDRRESKGNVADVVTFTPTVVVESDDDDDDSDGLWA